MILLLKISSCVRLFANDIFMNSALSCCGDGFQFQRDIEALGCWSNKWRMTFNVSKCSSVMFVTKSRNVQLEEISYRLNNKIIPTVRVFEYLGIVIDSNLKWEKHTNTTISKAMRILGSLKSTLWHQWHHTFLRYYGPSIF